MPGLMVALCVTSCMSNVWINSQLMRVRVMYHKTTQDVKEAVERAGLEQRLAREAIAKAEVTMAQTEALRKVIEAEKLAATIRKAVEAEKAAEAERKAVEAEKVAEAAKLKAVEARKAADALRKKIEAEKAAEKGPQRG